MGIGGLLPRPLLNWVPIFCWLTGLVSIVGLWFRSLEHNWRAKVQTFDCDLEVQDDRDRLIESIRQQGDSLDVLVNNAAFVGTSSLEAGLRILNIKQVETWRRALEVNLTAAFDLSRGLRPLKHSEGKHRQYASTCGSYGPDYSLYKGTEMGNPAAYAASRWFDPAYPLACYDAGTAGTRERYLPAEYLESTQVLLSATKLGLLREWQPKMTSVVPLLIWLVTYPARDWTVLAVDGGWGVW